MSEKFPFTVTEDDQFAFVARTGDKVMPMRLASEDQRDEHGRRYAYSTRDATTHDGIYESKPVSDDKLSPDNQAALSDKLDQFARESADMPLLTDTVFAKQQGHVVEGRLTGLTTIDSPSGSHRYGDFIDTAGNKSRVPIESLTLDAQAELDEQKNKKYLAEAKKLVEQTQNVDETTKRMLIDTYLASVDRGAKEGEIISSHDGKALESNQVEELFDKFARALSIFEDPSKKSSKVVMQNVPRSNGLRDAFTALLQNEGTAAVFEQAIKDKYEKETTEGGSLRQPLGRAAMTGVDVASPEDAVSDASPSTGEVSKSKIESLGNVQDSIDKLTQDLSVGDLRRLVQLSAASTEQEIELARRGMSDELRGNDKLIDQYLELAEQRAALRAG